jgi:hypothetical protein
VILKHVYAKCALENLRVSIGLWFKICGTRRELDWRVTCLWVWCYRLKSRARIGNYWYFEKCYIIALPGFGTFARDKDQCGAIVVRRTSHGTSEFGRGGVFPFPIPWWHSTDGTAEWKLEVPGNIWCRARDFFMGRDRKVKPLVSMGSAVCCGNPRVHRIVPPGWTQGLLIMEQAADPFDETLNLPFNWILMLVTRSG